MIGTIILLFTYVFVPVALIYLSERFRVLEKIGSVLLAYAFGLLIGNVGIIENVIHYKALQEALNGITILLALPLLLFSLDLRRWFKDAGKAALALLVLLFSVIVAVVLGYFIFKNDIEEPWKISGLLMGVYSGGTPNLAALKEMLDVTPEKFIMVNTLDMFVTAMYLLFLMTLGKSFFRKFLPKYKFNGDVDPFLKYESETNYKGIFQRINLLPLFKAMGYSLVIVILSIGVSFLIAGEISMLILILSITTFSILASLIRQVNEIKYTFQTGMYFIVIFCMVVASMANISELGSVAINIFKYISFVIFGSLIIKLMLSKLFKIDADTMIIASTALICSPPFVPVMAGVLKNKQIIVTGLTIGIIGYAVGNYLGVTIAYILKMF